MKFCAISVCKNNFKKKAGPQLLRVSRWRETKKKYTALCRHADKEFASIENLHVCSEHCETKQTVKTLSGIKRLAHGTVPTILNQHTICRSPNQREKRSNERRKRDASGDIIEVSTSRQNFPRFYWYCSDRPQLFIRP